MSDELEPLDSRTAKEMYLKDRQNDLSDATLQTHHYRLKQFVEWCEDEGIENLNTLSGRDLHRFRIKRQNEDGLATASMRGQLATLRMFIRFCGSINAVEPTLDEKILLPSTSAEDARDAMLDSDQARKILDHLERYRFAELEHVWLEVIWHTGIRSGSGRGLDVDDYNADKQYLSLKHRPEQDTPLKNGGQGERLVALNDRVSQVFDEWLDVNHPGKSDDYGRVPLFATKHGPSEKVTLNERCVSCKLPCPQRGGESASAFF